MLVNIVVAVLLDEFISTVAQEKASEAEEQERAERMRQGIIDLKGPLDAVLRLLAKFSSAKRRDVRSRVDVSLARIREVRVSHGFVGRFAARRRRESRRAHSTTRHAACALDLFTQDPYMNLSTLWNCEWAVWVGWLDFHPRPLIILKMI